MLTISSSFRTRQKITLAYLAYLGYPHSSTSSSLLPTTSALIITRPRKQDRKKGTVSRSVFVAYVTGATGSGKTTLLKSFIGKGYDGSAYEPTMKVKTVVNAVEIGGEEKYLVVSSLVFFPLAILIRLRPDSWFCFPTIAAGVRTESSLENAGIAVEETGCARPRLR